MGKTAISDKPKRLSDTVKPKQELNSSGMTRMTLAAYARHRKVTKAAVSIAIKEKRLTPRVDKKTGKKFVFQEEADNQWTDNTDVRRTIAPPPPPGLEDDDIPLEIKSGGGSSSYKALMDAKAEKEQWAAKQAQLTYEIKAGEYVRLDVTKKEWSRVGRIIRNNHQTLPDRLAPILVGLSVDKIHEILTRELNQALEALDADSSEDE
jgi:hypothetical protein